MCSNFWRSLSTRHRVVVPSTVGRPALSMPTAWVYSCEAGGAARALIRASDFRFVTGSPVAYSVGKAAPASPCSMPGARPSGLRSRGTRLRTGPGQMFPGPHQRPGMPHRKSRPQVIIECPGRLVTGVLSYQRAPGWGGARFASVPGFLCRLSFREVLQKQFTAEACLPRKSTSSLWLNRWPGATWQISGRGSGSARNDVQRIDRPVYGRFSPRP